MAQLRAWEEARYQIWGVEAGKIPKPTDRGNLEKRAPGLEAKGLTGISFSMVRYKRCSKVDAVRSWRFQHGLVLLGLMSLCSRYSRITFFIVAYQSFPPPDSSSRAACQTPHLLCFALHQSHLPHTCDSPESIHSKISPHPRPSRPTHRRQERGDRNSTQLTNNNLLPRHRRVPRDIHKRLRAVFQVRLPPKASVPHPLTQASPAAKWTGGIGGSSTYHFLQPRPLLQELDPGRRVVLSLHTSALALPSLAPFPGEKALTHSVSSRPGSTALTRTRGPCVAAKQRISCSCAALVTQYGRLLPAVEMPAIEEVMMSEPPSGFALKVGSAVRRRWFCALTLTAKHVSQSEVSVEDRSGMEEKRVQPWWVVRRGWWHSRRSGGEGRCAGLRRLTR